ncbi:MAG: ACP S-malonyltransferase [Clostridiales bacterium]|nr:ACP S-malonyltransferase [Clostridiales bacterium]
MGKIAFVFSGQGAQYSGMGRELFEQLPECRSVFDKADALRPGTSGQCFTASAEELSETKNTQPCMFAVEMAAAAALEKAGVRADCAAGFSLGEIAALSYTGVVSFDDGFRLVCRRGELMQSDAEKVESAMAAVVKLPAEEVKRICSGLEGVYPVNYNCPGQTSVACLKDKLEELSALVKAAGGRAIPLKVKGGFHSPFMAGAAEAFGEAVRSMNVKEPEIALYSDYTAQPYSGDYAELLSRQICNPVRWQSIVENMIAGGVDTFIELGPGKTLCGLIAKINSSVRCFHVEDCASLEETLKGVGAC